MIYVVQHCSALECHFCENFPFESLPDRGFLHAGHESTWCVFHLLLASPALADAGAAWMSCGSPSGQMNGRYIKTMFRTDFYGFLGHLLCFY